MIIFITNTESSEICANIMKTIHGLFASTISHWEKRRRFGAVVIVFSFSTCQLLAQDQTLQNLKTVGYQDALKAFAKPVLDSCASYPPVFVNKKDVNNPKAKLTNPDASNDLLAALAADASVDNTVYAREYDGLFLRLFDSVNTFNVGTANTNLFGFISGATDSTDALSALWGTSMFAAKYDCIALLNISAGASGNYSLPFFYVGGAFNASRDVKKAKQASLIYGRFESPFSRYYFGKDLAAQTYAAMKAIAWREAHGRDITATYVKTARLLSIQITDVASESNTISGSLKAGVSIPLVSVNGTIGGSLVTQLTSSDQAYVTYFDGAPADLQAPLPGFNDLLKALQSNIGAQRYSLDHTELTKGKNISTASITIDGWPSELCNGKWTARANPAYAIDADLKPAGWKCNITFRMSLSGPNADKATADDIGNPALYLQYNDDTQLRIVFAPQEKPHLLGDTHMDLDTDSNGWTNSPATVTDEKSVDYLEWDLTGSVTLPDKSKELTAASLNPANFSCKDSTGKPLSFTTVGFPQSGSADLRPNSPVAAGTTTVKLAARVNPKQLPRHDTDPNQDVRPRCTVTGTITVTLMDASTNTSVDQTLAVSARHDIEFPSEIPDALLAPNVTVSAPGVGQIILSWKKIDGARTYNIFRSEIAGAEDYTSPLNKTPITALAYSDSTGTAGTPYFYIIAPYNALGELGNKSAEATGTPKAAAKPTSAPALQYSLNKDKTAVTLTWNSVDSAAVYDLHRVDYRNHQLDSIIQAHVAVTTATDQIADPSAVLSYYVVAFVSSNASPPSTSQMVVPN